MSWEGRWQAPGPGVSTPERGARDELKSKKRRGKVRKRPRPRQWPVPERLSLGLSQAPRPATLSLFAVAAFPALHRRAHRGAASARPDLVQRKAWRPASAALRYLEPARIGHPEPDGPGPHRPSTSLDILTGSCRAGPCFLGFPSPVASQRFQTCPLSNQQIGRASCRERVSSPV